MERLPLIAYLFLLSFTCLTSLTTLLLLIWGYINRSFRYRIYIQLVIVSSKLAFDVAAVILGAFASSGGLHLDDCKIWLIQFILFWGSSICIPSYEHFFLWAVYNQCSTTGPGRIIHAHYGILITIILCLVPLIAVRFPKHEYLLVCGTTSLHFLLFGSFHLWLLIHLNSPDKWKPRLVSCFATCCVIFAVSICSSMIGWKEPEAQGLLTRLNLTVTSIHLLIRVWLCVTKEPKSGASEAARHIGQFRRPATATSQEALVWDASVGDYVFTDAPVTRLPSTYQPAPSPSDAECDHKTQTHPADKPPSSLPNTEKSDQGEQATPETGRDTPEQEAELYEDWERYREEEEKKEDHGWRLGETGIMLLQQK